MTFFKENRKPNRIGMVMAVIGLCFSGCGTDAGKISSRDAGVDDSARDPVFDLVRAGEPAAVIVLPADATHTAQFAAQEFQDHIEAITGAVLPMAEVAPDGVNAVHIGPSDFVRSRIDIDRLPGGEAYAILSDETSLILAGKDGEGVAYVSPTRPGYEVVPHGTMHAVYRFLEDVCGIRWFIPDERVPDGLGAVIPRVSTLSVPRLHRTGAPYFDYRVGGNIDWNTYRQAGTLDIWTAYRDGTKPYPWPGRIGFGGLYRGYLTNDGQHSFMLLSRDPRIRAEHPEYFALMENGERDFDTSSFRQGNLCLSNPDVKDAFVQLARDYFDRYPSRYIFAVSPNDCMYDICRCEQCQAWLEPDYRGRSFVSPQERRAVPFERIFSNYVWNFVNEVAKEVYISHPDKWILNFAYEGYREPPTDVEPLSPNIALMVAKSRGSFWDEEYRAYTYDLIQRWAERVNRLYSYDYYLWEARNIYGRPRMRGLPVAFPRLIAADLRHMAGIEEYQGGFLDAKVEYSPALSHLNSYVTAKAYWDPYLDIDALLEDYYTKFYGPARDVMKRFWERAEQGWMRPTTPILSPDQSAATMAKALRTVFSPEDIQAFFALLAEAREKTEPGTPERKRIKLIEAEMEPARGLTAPAAGWPMLNVLRHTPDPLDARIKDWWAPGRTERTSRFVYTATGAYDSDYRTGARVSYDDENLYVFFWCVEPHMERLQTGSHRGLWDDDSVEIFIQPDPECEPVAQIIINADGETWSAFHHHPDYPDPAAWSSEARHTVEHFDEQWQAEIAIPWASLGLSLRPNLTLKANFYRNRFAGGERVGLAWSPVPVIERHLWPPAFGTLNVVVDDL